MCAGRVAVGRRLPLRAGRLQREVKARAQGFISVSVARGRDDYGQRDGGKGQWVSGAEARLDLLHLKKIHFAINLVLLVCYGLEVRRQFPMEVAEGRVVRRSSEDCS